MSDLLSRWFRGRPNHQRQSAGNNRPHQIRPNLESLEDRLSPAVFNVNTTVDLLNPGPGDVTLRPRALQAAKSGTNTINLTVAGTYYISLVGPAGEHDNAAGAFAISSSPGSSLIINNTSGGAVAVDGNHLSGVFVINPASTTFSVTFQGFTIQNGLVGSGGNGGGITVQGGNALTLNNMSVINNDAASGNGGGIDVNAGAVLTVTNSTISNNRAGVDGGGIDNAGGSVSLATSLFANNIAGVNGGGYSDEKAGSLSVTNSSFTANSATASGGAIFVGGPTLNIFGSTISGNTTTGSGGAIELQSTGTGFSGSTITNSTIVGNIALDGGANNGGAIDASTAFTGNLTLLYDTINGNAATNGGGIFWTGTPGSGVGVQNTIIAQNNATTAQDFDNVSGNILVDLGNNVIGVADTITFPNKSTQNGTAGGPLNPLLGPLQNNGGPQAGAPGSQVPILTEALLSGSPAIGKAAAVTVMTDERGSPRPNATPDVGAYQTLCAPKSYVEYLYSNFLHRVGDLNNPNDAGGWVNQITAGQITQAAVASAIARSQESLNFIVNGLYMKLLNRNADPVGLAGFVKFMQSGGTVEQVTLDILNSTEYSNLQSSNTMFVQSLYTNLLGRNGSPSEVAGWLNLIPSLSRLGVASSFLTSVEYRADEVQQLYGFPVAPAGSLPSQLPNLLHRSSPPSAGEILFWVNSGLDILSIEVLIAGSPEAMTFAATTTFSNLA